MKILPLSVKKLIEELLQLPGVGPKTAERLAFHLLKKRDEDLEKLSQAIQNLKKNLKVCSSCCNISDKNPCDICESLDRDKSQIMVVEKSLDAAALEKTGQFKGVYHILGGAISPIDGVTTDDLTIDKLIGRVKNKGIKEVILAINPSLEGESTAAYIQKVLKPFKVKITRIARGLPMGGDLEYADEVTIIRALEGRREY